MGDGKALYALFCTGLISVAAQVVLLRELSTFFSGNEMTVGIFLAAWMLLVAAGSYAAASFLPRHAAGKLLLGILLAGCAVSFPLEVLFARVIRQALGTASGERVGLDLVVASCFLVPAVYCIISGYCFTLACRIRGKDAGGSYVAESAGFLAGGIVYSFFLAGVFSSLEIAFLFSAFGLLCAGTILRGEHKLLAYAAYALVLMALACFYYGPPIDAYLRAIQWGEGFVSSIDSVYGNFVVMERGGQYSFYVNGVLSHTSQDVGANEALVHPVLLEHPDPSQVLVIGGAGAAYISEVLKHPVSSVIYAEPDEKAFDAAKRYLPEINQSLSDPRVHVVSADGRFLLGEMKDSLDVVLVASSEPDSAQINRFYTKEFFEEAKGSLKERGIFALAVPLSASYSSPEKKALSGSIYKTVRVVFPEVLVLPQEERALIIASKEKGLLSSDPEVLIGRLKERRIDPAYAGPEFLEHYTAEDKVLYALESLNRASIQINTDEKPVGYYYCLLLWSRMAGNWAGPLLDSACLPFLLGFPLLLCVMLWILRPGISIPIAACASGLAGMVLQVVLLLSFQSKYGIMYHRMALIVALFMAGLACGGWCMNKAVTEGKTGRRALFAVFCSLAVYSFFLAYALAVDVSESVFYLFPAASGLLTGLCFPLAASIYVKGRPIERAAGILYSMDLLGGCAGALLTSLVLVPFLGMSSVLMLIALLMACTGVLIVAKK